MYRRGCPDINDYRKDYWKTRVQPKLELVMGWARNGLSNEQIALNLGITPQSFYKYLKLHEDLENALFIGREDAELLVENAMFKKAIGYDTMELVRERCKQYDEDGVWRGQYEMQIVKKMTKHVPPDFMAQKYWLENRAPKKWTREGGQSADRYDDGFLEALQGSASKVWEDDDDESSI